MCWLQLLRCVPLFCKISFHISVWMNIVSEVKSLCILDSFFWYMQLCKAMPKVTLSLCGTCHSIGFSKFIQVFFVIDELMAANECILRIEQYKGVWKGENVFSDNCFPHFPSLTRGINENFSGKLFFVPLQTFFSKVCRNLVSFTLPFSTSLFPVSFP